MNANSITSAKVNLEDIRHNTRRISFRLGLMNEWQRIPSQVFSEVRDLIEKAHSTPDGGLYAKLHAIRRRHVSDFFVCYTLLRQSLNVPTNSKAAVIRMCRETFVTCLGTPEGDILREELEELLWHGNRNLRGLAMGILEVAPISQRQIRLLTALGTYEDQRLAIAHLIINRGNIENLKPLLQYMISVVKDCRHLRTERDRVATMFGQLGAPEYFELQPLLIELMQALFDNSEDFEVKGMLLKPLYELDEELVGELRHLYKDRNDPSQRAVMIWLLEKLLARGSTAALELMLSLFSQATVGDRQPLGDSLANGIILFARRNKDHFAKPRFQSEVAGFVTRLQESLLKVDIRLGERLKDIDWSGVTNSESLLQALIEGTLKSKTELHEVRRSGSEAIDFCIAKLSDSESPLFLRIEAANRVPWFQVAKARTDLPAILWNYYQRQDFPPSLRVELLRSLARLATERRPPEASRQFLESEIKGGAPHLTQALIQTIWPQLYPSAPLVRVS